MKVIIESDGFKIWEPLQEHAEEKLQKIKDLQPLSIELLLKESESEYGDKKAEILVKIKGHEIYAEYNSHKFEGSINKVVSKARKQLIRLKDKKKERVQ